MWSGQKKNLVSHFLQSVLITICSCRRKAFSPRDAGFLFGVKRVQRPSQNSFVYFSIKLLSSSLYLIKRWHLKPVTPDSHWSFSVKGEVYVYYCISAATALHCVGLPHKMSIKTLKVHGCEREKGVKSL